MPFTEPKPNPTSFEDEAAYFEAVTSWRARRSRWRTLVDRAKEAILAQRDAESELAGN